jgi:hypothetical protein
LLRLLAALLMILPAQLCWSHLSPLFVLTLSANVTQPATKAVVIDGSKNPELFPEWFVWERIFDSIGSGAISRASPRSLGISEPEFTLLTTQAKMFRYARDKAEKQIADTIADLRAKKTKEDEIRNATIEIELQYRHHILDARHQIYEHFSPEGLQNIRKLANTLLAVTTMHLRGRAVEYFHLPW